MLKPNRWFAVPALLLVISVLAGLPSVRAQQGWVVRSFDAALTVQANGDVEVVETVRVDFGSLESRGIFREITVEYVYEPDPDYHRVLNVTVQGVSRDGSREEYTTYREGANLVVRIGNPDVYLTGEHTYEVRYRARGALNPQDTWDELYWNVTGNYWETTIENASATVSAPAIEEVICFQGSRGSREQCSITAGPQPSFTTTRSLPPGSGLTIAVQLTKGSVAVAPLNLVKQKSEIEKAKDFIGLSPLKLASAVFLGILGITGLGRYWWLNGRDKWYGDVHYLTGNQEATIRPLFARDTVVVEYMPPEIGGRQSRRVRPAEIGTLLDERADTLDVTATLVDLAVRGYLRIEEIEKTWLFGSKDYRLEKLKEQGEEMLDYESSLLRRLFSGGDSLLMSGLKNEFYKDLAKVKEMLYTQVTSKNKWFPKSPEKVRGLHIGAGIAIMVAGAVAAVFLGQGIGAAIIGAPIVLVGLLVLITAGMMPHRTPSGREMYRRVLGFREYIEVAEKDRQRFFEDENIFQEYLPYAIVYGSVHKWAKAFEDMGIEPNTSGWYVGTTPFRAMAFSSSLQTFSSSMSSAISSTPGGSGSSGFSGGGSSGGGVGGGGGGRW